MSRSNMQSLFFIGLPDLRKLCSVNLSLLSEAGDGESRNKQIKMCRELIFLYPDLLASPVFGIFSEITVIMAINFFKTGTIQAFAQRHGLQMGAPNIVRPGKDFLTETGRLNALVMELNATDTQLCVSLEASTVRLPPAKLEDFDISPNIVKNFYNNRDAVIQKHSMPSNWCYILPSMKMGQIISISHQPSAECPFQSYTEMQKHWNSLYGYRLPVKSEADALYCSVYFKPVGERLFTYPLCCIRSQPAQLFPRVNLESVLSAFLSDLKSRLRSVCGFPVKMTSKPCYSTSSLHKLNGKELSSRPVNLTTKAVCRAVLTQLPANTPKSDSMGAVQERLRQQEGECRRTQCTVGSAEEQPQRLARAPQSAGVGPPAASFPRQPSVPEGPRDRSRGWIIPIFKNKSLQRHINVTKILADRKQQAPTPAKAAALQRPVVSRVGTTRPVFLHLPAATQRSGPPVSPSARTGTLSSQITQKTPFCRKNPAGLHPDFGVGAQVPLGAPLIPSKARAGAMLTNKSLHHHQASPTALLCTGLPKKHPESKINPQEDGLESKTKRSRPNVQDVDVEEYARNNQLFKINSATLQAWLKMHGISVKSKDKKEDLVSKVMTCVGEP
ncbi:uncharacterized protein C18orf63 homolog [Amia ocellicauda]|uniref:uncharacterized protein C18orf63 homolog n=1 Tax=Amia ocellicauda TaxID=2972642 RepID=UPI003464E03F